MRSGYILLLLSLTVATNTFGQDSTRPKRITDTTSQLKGIIVTASRIAESVNEVPSSVTLISRKEVEKQAQINNNLPYILMQKVPGISPSEEGQNNFIGKLRGRNFLVLIDGIPQSTPLRNGGRDLRTIDVSAIDHIEVINGASSMYGNGGAGGIINYITIRPEKNVPFSSSTYFNNSLNLVKPDETYGYNISQVFKGRTGGFDYVLQGKMAHSGVVRSSDGVVVSPFYGLGETRTYNALVKLGYDFSTNHRIEVMGNYFNSIQDSKYIGTKGNFGISPAIGVRGDTNILGGTPYNKTINVKYTGTFGKTEANVVAYFNDINSVFEAYNQIYSDHWGARFNMSTPVILPGNNHLQLIYGIDFLKDHTVQKDMADKLVTPDMNMNSIAPYLQSKFVLAQNWILKAGVRYENLLFKVSDFTKGNQLVPGATNTYDALVFNAGLRYNKCSYIQPFASFSQGFSIGDVGLVLRNGVSLNAINLAPVKVNNFELGVNGDVQRFRYEVTGYYNTSKKGTTFKEITPGNFDLTQLPQRIYGVEAVLGFKATDWLSVGSILSYMDGKEDTKNDGSYDGKMDNSIISPIKVGGNVNFKFTRQWDFSVQMTNIGGRNVFPKEVWNYGKYPISGYTLFDMYTSYKLRHVTFTFAINNLFNANYYPTHSEVRGATTEGRYYVKATGTVANLGIVVNL
ncbi:TonB-dependent receptor [Chitinophaga sp. G-6-1-13]|uniref:TonB-dependent receptor n=1 Tax=Chitinophaga fulva TaxID=2728842 RepID=A0A848GQ56_9BACT|nr:TonB-dependent receptor [Chitinophaga fulva]NML39172.1 TonB-dependent receptor [Chitinophaga fulva]